MDTRWKWSKVYDIEVTPLGLWTLAGSGETPQQVNDDNQKAWLQ